MFSFTIQHKWIRRRLALRGGAFLTSDRAYAIAVARGDLIAFARKPIQVPGLRIRPTRNNYSDRRQVDCIHFCSSLPAIEKSFPGHTSSRLDSSHTHPAIHSFIHPFIHSFMQPAKPAANSRFPLLAGYAAAVKVTASESSLVARTSPLSYLHLRACEPIRSS